MEISRYTPSPSLSDNEAGPLIESYLFIECIVIFAVTFADTNQVLSW